MACLWVTVIEGYRVLNNKLSRFIHTEVTCRRLGQGHVIPDTDDDNRTDTHPGICQAECPVAIDYLGGQFMIHLRNKNIQYTIINEDSS